MKYTLYTKMAFYLINIYKYIFLLFHLHIQFSIHRSWGNNHIW